MTMTPIRASSCAQAATAAEARFRIDVPIAPSRATRVIALDAESAAAVRQVADQPWASARFFTCQDGVPASSVNGSSADSLRLRTMDGSAAHLGEELTGVDVAVMVATTDEGASAASAIGEACSLRGIMTAGLVLSAGNGALDALAALRPHARVLIVPAEQEDLSELLTALRA